MKEKSKLTAQEAATLLRDTEATARGLLSDLQADALALKLDGKKAVVGVQLIFRIKEREPATGKRHVVYVAHDDPTALESITAYVLSEWEPIGKLMVTKADNGGWDMKVKVVAARRGDKEVEAFLDTITDKLAGQIMGIGCFNKQVELPPGTGF